MRDYSSVENISGERGEALTLVLGSTKILIRSKIIAQQAASDGGAQVWCRGAG